MDVLDRFYDEREIYRALANSIQGNVLTAFPVRVTTDSDGHTVSLQPLIKSVRRNADGSQELIDFPVIPQAPINHVSGGGTTMTVPVKKDDYGYAIISCRSIDAYQQQGGIQQQVDARMHDLSDAIYCPGLKPDPSKLSNVSTTSTQIRSDDGKHFSDWDPKAGTITHSVEGGKHKTTVSRDGGITHSADNGKHTVSLTDAGIALKTAMAVAMQADKGMDLKGALAVTGKITSTLPIGGGILNGALQGGLGGIFTGIANAVIGGIVGAGLMLLLQGGSPSRETIQVARFVPAILQGAR